MSGYIYLIRMKGTDYFKIGISRTRIQDRLATLQTANPVPLVLVAWREHDNPFDVEQSIHAALSDCRVRGEWFCGDEHALLRVFEDFNNMALIDVLLPSDADPRAMDSVDAQRNKRDMLALELLAEGHTVRAVAHMLRREGYTVDNNRLVALRQQIELRPSDV
jgi:hypothetical protein